MLSDMSLKSLNVYVVNLDRRRDRWKKVRNTLYSQGFTNIIRVSAVDGRKIDTDQLKMLLSESAYDGLGKVRRQHEDLGSVGAVGCYLSHYKIWAKILESGVPAIVAEDDMVLLDNMDNFDAVQDYRILNAYDLVWLGYGVLRDAHPPVSKSGIYPYKGMSFCTHFYYLTPKGAEILISNCFPIMYQVDSFIGFQITQGLLRAAYHHPNLSWQHDNITDIQTPMSPEDVTQRKKIFIRIILFFIVCMLFIAMYIIFYANVEDK